MDLNIGNSLISFFKRLEALHSLPGCLQLNAYGIRYTLHSNTPEAVFLCQEYVSPYFLSSPDPHIHEPDLHIYFSVVHPQERDLIRALMNQGPPLEAAHLFNFDDDQFVRQPLNGHLILSYSPEKQDLLTIVDLEDPRVYVLDLYNRPDIAQFTLIRIIRNLTRHRIDHSTHCPLHAAAVSLDGSGILLTGSKYAGKTTLLTALLTFTPAHFVSNDRVSINRILEVLGWPYSPGVRPGTIRSNRSLQKYFQKHLDDPYPFNRYTMASMLSPEQKTPKVTFRFPPRAFCKIFEKEIVPTTLLRLIIQPIYDQEVQYPVATVLSTEEALRVLREQAVKAPFYFRSCSSGSRTTCHMHTEAIEYS